MITKEEYDNAVKTVKEYQTQLFKLKSMVCFILMRGNANERETLVVTDETFADRLFKDGVYKQIILSELILVI